MTEGAKKRKNERRNELTRERREKKLCIACGRQDERTRRGLARCAVCWEKQKASKAKYRGAYKEKNDEYREQYRAKCRAEHRCVDCGKQDRRTLLGHSACYECQRKRSERTRRQRQTLKAAKDESFRRRTYHITRLFEYPLLVGDYQNGEYVTAETYAKEYYKKRQKK